MNNTSLLIVGVGGQGTLLTSRILGNLVMDMGYDVKVSEVHGMAQRGGSVVTHVRYGEKVYSPLVEIGGADVVLAFEKLEGLRWLPYLKENGILIVNNQSIDPMPVIMGVDSYPEDITEKIQEKCKKTLFVDALSIAEACGSVKAVNTVLLGVLAKFLQIDIQYWIKAIEATVPPRTIAVNREAFLKGHEYSIR